MAPPPQGQKEPRRRRLTSGTGVPERRTELLYRDLRWKETGKPAVADDTHSRLGRPRQACAVTRGGFPSQDTVTPEMYPRIAKW